MQEGNELELRLTGRIAAEGRDAWVPEAGTRKKVRGIPFRDFMAACLYDERLGYYRSGRVRIGKEGDFYTSSGIGTVMGDVLAAYMARDAFAAGVPRLVYEWGAGTGRLGLQMLARWSAMPEMERAEPVRYRMVDANPGHRQAARRAAAEAGFGEQVRFLAPELAEEELSAAGPCVVVANELLDAFPVRRFKRLNGVLREIGTFYDEAEGRFRDCLLEHSEYADGFASRAHGVRLAEGQEAEWSPDAEAWLDKLCRMLPGGRIILIDYGDCAGELYAPHRMRGTLLCYRNHTAHDDPYVHIGEQDMTAHVNFSSVRKTAEAAGWRVASYSTQKRFLVDNGVLQELRNHRDPNPFGEAARRNRAIRQLLLSDGMSESFKVMVLAK